ncbi:MAG: hypothetical protein EU531_08565 [Promethearchaeota archaeon]|nr:MAG: hypothetical protein EU531_08565 [Candidatus Lokiarchaeota archaeon]
MEHKKLSIEYDLNLIEKTLDDKDMRYIVLFLYVIRNDLFKDFSNTQLIESYERILILDDIFKSNIVQFWEREFIEIAIDLGLFKNIRSIQEFDQKDDDFIIRLGEETVTLENDALMVPDDLLYLMIHKKFKNLSRRDFNLALTKLQALKCEKANIIHPFIFQIDEHDYNISNELYYILDQYGNIYQAIKIEITIQGFEDRFIEIRDSIRSMIEIFDPILITKPVLQKINTAIENKNEIIPFIKEEKIKLPEKFNTDKIDKDLEIFRTWIDKLNLLLLMNNELYILEKEISEIKRIYNGKHKKNSYLQFIEKVSFNEDNIVINIQEQLIALRDKLVKIQSKISELTKKDLKLLNLDYERLIIMSNED